jgi:hypothetical protein
MKRLLADVEVRQGGIIVHGVVRYFLGLLWWF